MPAHEIPGEWRYDYAGRALSCAFELSPMKASHRPSARADLVVRSGPDAPQQDGVHWLHHWQDDDEVTELSLGRSDDDFLLRFPDVADFLIAETGEIEVRRVPGAGACSVDHLLLDQVLPRVLAHRGELVLHASAATTSTGEAILALGPSGSGKSTLAATLAALAGGCALADDCVVVSIQGDRLMAMPAYPGLRLWPDSSENLFPSEEGGEPVADYSDKLRVAMPAVAPAMAGGWPVAAMLVLDDGLGHAKPADDDATVHFATLAAGRACMTLTANAFQLDVGNARSVRRLLTLAAGAAAHAPMIALRYPRDYAALSHVGPAILHHLHQPLPASGPASP